ncbi:uncharacterized protein LOC114943529 [Nylanderia fulva]|uniref:uncharacterized protein LOC114943529 n=1 Tax=Nylanderia fulva TaxID=613905 RepID=UPI0010FB78B1|nr:uncharacterized protein LOC114943529 [Nylanderia fulva]
MANTITTLPEEMITIILSYNDITIEDIISFRCVCKRFQYAVTYEKFMERKFLQRWPNAKKEFEEYIKKGNDNKQYKENIWKKENINFNKIGIYYVKQLKKVLSLQLFNTYYAKLSKQNDYNIETDKLIKSNDQLDECFNKRFVKPITYIENHIMFAFFVDEIRNLLKQLPGGSDRNLIERYCDINKSHYMKLSSVKSEFGRFIEKSTKREFLLEKICTLMAQYFQPRKDVCYCSVNASLDKIAQEVLNCLREKHPNHSIFSTSEWSPKTFFYWKNNNIDDNHWDEAESTQIMDTLQEYIFGKLEFQPRHSSKINNMCIDYVLENKRGRRIMVFIIYQSVARRLGLRCDIIKVEFQICIFWKSKYVTNNLVNERCFYIECKKFPNCFVDYLSHYTSLVSDSGSSRHVTAIEIKEIYFEIITFYKNYLDFHINYDTEVIEIWNMLRH